MLAVATPQNLRDLIRYGGNSVVIYIVNDFNY